MQTRSEAIRLPSRDVDVGIVAEMVETVQTWARDWRGIRRGSIHTGYEDNLSASELSAEQRAEVVAVWWQPPSDEGLPVRFWSVSAGLQVVYACGTPCHFRRHLTGLSLHILEAVEHAWKETNNHISDIQHATVSETRYAFEKYTNNSAFLYPTNEKILFNGRYGSDGHSRR